MYVSGSDTIELLLVFCYCMILKLMISGVYGDFTGVLIICLHLYENRKFWRENRSFLIGKRVWILFILAACFFLSLQIFALYSKYFCVPVLYLSKIIFLLH